MSEYKQIRLVTDIQTMQAIKQLGKPTTVDELRNCLGLSESAIRHRLKRLRTRGKVKAEIDKTGRLIIEMGESR